MKRPLAYITAAWCGSDAENAKQAAQYCRSVYEAGFSPICPTFVLFCNSAKLFHFSYQRYLENQLRAVFGFEGTPIKLVIRQKGEDGDKL